jgi:hypothetical protein
MDILIGFGGTIFHILFTAIIIRHSSRSPALIVLIVGFICYTSLFFIPAATGLRHSFWSLSISYWFGSLSFLMVFGAIYKSVSLRMMLDLLDSPEHSLPEQDLLASYIKSTSFEDRLDVSLKSGLAEKSPEGYLLLPKGRMVARLVQGLHRAFAIKKSG